MGVQFRRQKELLSYYRGLGYYVVAGGSYASLCPERYETLADTVVAGEAEYIWKEFCRDYEKGTQRALYEEKGVVSLADSPTPRFDLLKLDRYTNISLQFSRGCPFLCEFCDIIIMFGRKPRTKSREQVGRELDALRALHAHNVFFVDDNFIGDKNVAKDLLRFLRDYQRDHNYRFQFGTEASLNLAQDNELLTLFPAANFAWVFIGIESPDEESLKETKKLQNTREDILTSVRRIYEHGLDIFAGFIIGFDNDTMKTFESQYRFIVDSGIQVAMVGLLTALPKTPLYKRLESEGRLLPGADGTDNTSIGTNFIPKQIEYDTLVREYRHLYERLLKPSAIAERIGNKMRYMKKPNSTLPYSVRTQLGIVAKFAWRGIVRGGPTRMLYFARTLSRASLKQVPLVLSDWIAALSMKEFAERHLLIGAEQSATAAQFEKLRHSFRSYLQQGRVRIQMEQGNISLRLQGLVDQAFYAKASRAIKDLLENTSSTVTLHVEHFQEEQRQHWQRLLHRLRRDGDRIYVSASERLKEVLEVDSSVFHLVLEPSA
ncbi:MAG: B12-binding domain-containing radical SAM protein [Acidobacteriota bacterium]|nr:B12-binding domain-containing radical SAM protein [Acidobacteriota bacterium]